MVLLHHLILLFVVLIGDVHGILPPSVYDDDTSPLPLRLDDLERDHLQQLDLNRPPLLPNHYEWQPEVAASLPPSYVQEAAQRERDLERNRRLEELRQLQQQHRQLSSGYTFPSHLPGVLYVGPTAATPTPTPPAATTTVASSTTRFGKPIVPYDLDVALRGLPYVTNNALTLPVPRPLPPPHARTPFIYGFAAQGSRKLAAQPLLVQQSKQFAYAPAQPPQRHYANGPRIPLPYPPSFVSFTTRRPGGPERSRPFRPSQPDPTPDLFAGRASKSLIDSYIPSWEVLRLLRSRQHQPQQQGFTPIARQTLAYPAPAHLRLYKRDSQEERSGIVKKSLGQNGPGKLKDY